MPERYLPTAGAPNNVLPPIKMGGAGSYIEKIDRISVSEVIASLISPGDTFILVDQATWGVNQIAGRRALPFLERDGQYWGLPPDDETAIRELERLRIGGARFIVFTQLALWWLHYYFGLRDFLRSNFRCVLDNDRLMVFDLGSSSAHESPATRSFR